MPNKITRKNAECPLNNINEMIKSLKNDHLDVIDFIQRIKWLKKTGKLKCPCKEQILAKKIVAYKDKI